MKLIPLLLLLVCGCHNSPTEPAPANHVDRSAISNQLSIFADAIENGRIPRSYDEETGYDMVSPGDWTCGFPAGSFWYMYELTGEEKWKADAQAATEMLAGVETQSGTHDLGFMVHCSYGNGWRITRSESFRETGITAAKTLAERFSPTIGAIRSWDWGHWASTYPVIIDNMMNLELLFWASETTGDPRFRDIAVTHANTTLKNHFRADHSSYHVVTYDEETGAVLSKVTEQGLHDESSWGRGQAWGLYGFVLCYRETGDSRYLTHAEKIAEYMILSLPADYVSYWDYNDPAVPSEDVQRDASAAAITASALFELSRYSTQKVKFRGTAESILSSLTENYLRTDGSNGGFLLTGSVGYLAAGQEVDAAINYADYYYLEALKRQENF